MPYVLLPLAVGEPDSKKSQLHATRRTYIKKLKENNLTPIFVSTIFSKEEVEDLLKLCSGVLLMGGTDINPGHYNEKKQKHTKLIKHTLDDLELMVLDKAFKYKMPILGICRGCQMINVSRGGALTQHLPNKYNCNHAVDTYTDLGKIKTKIKIDTNSNLYKIFGLKNALVNCGHHQCVSKIGKGLRISSTDKNGVPESIETIDPMHFCIGVQSHIETQSTKFSNAVFSHFKNAVLAYKKRT